MDYESRVPDTRPSDAAPLNEPRQLSSRGCAIAVFVIVGLIASSVIGFRALLVHSTGISEMKPDKGKETLASELNALGLARIPRQYERGARDSVFSGRVSYWFKFSFAPSEVASIEADVRRAWDNGPRQGTVVSNARYPAHGAAPSWWKPESLADPITLELTPYPGYWISVSRQTGDAYFFCSGH
jgi:hypothetical protein